VPLDERKSLAKLRSTVKRISEGKGPTLKHGTTVIGVSELANQFYCEKQVELSRLRGKTLTADMMIGRQSHEALLTGTVKISLEKLWAEIFSGKLTVSREMLLLATHGKIPIAGTTDAIIFNDGAPLLLLEYKFTKRAIPYRDRHVQANTYCYLLHQLGFDTSHLRYALVLASVDLRSDEEFRNRSLDTILDSIKKSRVELYSDGNVEAKAYITDFSEKDAIDDVEWALKYWRGEREAFPTPEPGKCRACEYKSVCEFSLA